MENTTDSSTEEIIKIHIPRWKELPAIELYLDQLVTYLENQLATFIYTDSEINNKENKVITKTMINNYVKLGILDAPTKKKYNKLHIAKLFVICILKQVYSINDIKDLIKLAIETASVEQAYNHFCHELEKAVYITFNSGEYTPKRDLTPEQYILKNVVQSFANKLYVEKVYLKK